MAEVTGGSKVGGKGKSKDKLTLAKGKGQRRELRAGIVFPVARIRRYLKAGRYAKRISLGASIYLSAVMEYLSAEVLELSGNNAQERKVKRITPRHIMFAIFNDQELHKFLHSVIIPDAGVIPHIHGALLTRGQQRVEYFKNHQGALFDDAPLSVIEDEQGDKIPFKPQKKSKKTVKVKKESGEVEAEFEEEEAASKQETDVAELTDELIRDQEIPMSDLESTPRQESIDVGKELSEIETGEMEVDDETTRATPLETPNSSSTPVFTPVTKKPKRKYQKR